MFAKMEVSEHSNKKEEDEDDCVGASYDLIGSFEGGILQLPSDGEDVDVIGESIEYDRRAEKQARAHLKQHHTTSIICVSFVFRRNTRRVSSVLRREEVLQGAHADHDDEVGDGEEAEQRGEPQRADVLQQPQREHH